MEKNIFLSWWLTLGFFNLFLFSVILHNFMYAFFGIEEPIFFLVALLAIAAFCVSGFVNLIYLLFRIIKKTVHLSFKRENILGYILVFTVAVICLGILLNIFRPGLLGWFAPRIFNFGFIIMITLSITYRMLGERQRDERMIMLSRNAMRVTMLIVVVEILLIMVIDNIYHLPISISMFLIYFLINILAIYRMLYILFVKIY